MSTDIKFPKTELIAYASTSQVANHGYSYSTKCEFSSKDGNEVSRNWIRNILATYSLKYLFKKNSDSTTKQPDQLASELNKPIPNIQIDRPTAPAGDYAYSRRLFSLTGIYYDILEGVLTEIIPITIHGTIIFVLYKYAKEKESKNLKKKVFSKVTRSFFIRQIANLATQQIGRTNPISFHEFVKETFIKPNMSNDLCNRYLSAARPSYASIPQLQARGEVAKIISGQIFYSSSLILILLARDIVQYRKKRITMRQLIKNILCETAGAISGLVGQTYGLSKGSYALGSLIGLVSGMLGHSITKKITNILIKDEIQVMIEQFNKPDDLNLNLAQMNNFIKFMVHNKSLNDTFFQQMLQEEDKEEMIKILIKEQLPEFKKSKFSNPSSLYDEVKKKFSS